MRLIDADALLEELPVHPDGGMRSVKEEGLMIRVRQTVKEAPTIGGWISVKDRLPDKEGQYLCWFGKNILAKGAAIATYLEKWKAFGSLESLETYPNVTHWMSIESPKEDA